LNKLTKILFTLLAISFSFYSYSSIRVTKAITQDDQEIIKLLNIKKKCSNLNNYEKEIICIKSIQEAQLKLIQKTDAVGNL